LKFFWLCFSWLGSIGIVKPFLFSFSVLFCLVAVSAQDSAFDKDPWPEAKNGPIKVFILAGQSNMQGQASLRTLEYLIYNQETASESQHWKDRNGDWNERRDVWVTTTDGDRSGYLKPGFGANEWKFGPELGFGWRMGEHFDEQVLLIKTCWGGRSVKKDFLPPSEPFPSDESLQPELERVRKGAYGKAYRDMIARSKKILTDPKAFFPDCEEGRIFELAGFVWFQGWNDMVDGAQRQEDYANYTKRIGSLIRDVRRDLDAPGLPVVIGELGASDRGAFQRAQENVTRLEGFSGNVIFSKTRQFWEPELAKMVGENVWKGADWVRFYNVGSDRGYHYLGSGRMMMKMGIAFGEGIIPMLGVPSER
jgi:alpha-galactosidase